MYSITYHLLELHCEVIVHTRKGVESHLAEIDFSLHIIKVNSYLWKPLSNLFCNFYHFL